MLKRLFTSNTRIKILTLFLLNPDEEYFIRELTRKLDEQINSVRRELDNLKKMGLLKSRTKNRKKYYLVNKNFVLFQDLRNIIIKAMSGKDDLVKKITKFGEVDFLALLGVFVNKQSPVDLLLVGDVDKEKLQEFLNTEIETDRPIRFSILSKDDFLYRIKCKDQFINSILVDPENIIAVNKLEKYIL
jgi:DNA-binding MarR family transcriptional regulator